MSKRVQLELHVRDESDSDAILEAVRVELERMLAEGLAEATGSSTATSTDELSGENDVALEQLETDVRAEAQRELDEREKAAQAVEKVLQEQADSGWSKEQVEEARYQEWRARAQKSIEKIGLYIGHNLGVPIIVAVIVKAMLG